MTDGPTARTAVPEHRLSPKVRTAWRVQAALPSIVLTIGSLAGAGTLVVAGMPLLAVLLVSAAFALVVSWLTFVPALRYRRWRWDVTDVEVRLQSGLIIVERTVIPMVRVQHVDTSQGPILSAFGLSEVRVWTAASRHAIPALADEEAEALRDRIAVLARVTDDGGL